MEVIPALHQNSYVAFNQLYEQWHRRTYFYFLKKVKLTEDAQDLTQQTFIRIWKYRAALSTGLSFETQLFQTARNVLIDELRYRSRIKRTGQIVDTASGQEVPDTVEHYTELEHKELLEKALQQLPPVRRRVFILHRLEGYSYKEIAEELSISVKTVDNHLSQAVRQLKELHLLTWILLLAGLKQF